MAIDLIKRWKLTRQKYKMKHVPYTEFTLKNGYVTQKYNYSFGKFKEITDQILKTYIENGYTRTDMINTWSEHTGILKADADRKLKGDVSVSSWELFTMLDALGFSFNIKSLIDTKYASTVERSSRGAWIIIKASGLIKFTLKINQDDYYDFHIDFLNNKKKAIQPKLTRYKKEVLKAYDWYFLEQTGKTKRPFVQARWDDAFKMKWYARDFDFLHQPHTKIIE